MILLFRNVSHGTCTVKGFPGFSLYNSSGHLLDNATRTRTNPLRGVVTPVAPVTLKAGDYASATVAFDIFNRLGKLCSYSASGAATPPGSTSTVHFSLEIGSCSLTINPIVYGTSGYTNLAKALVPWKQGNTASPAHRANLWRSAATDLAHGEHGPLNPQSTELLQLASLPYTQLTAARNAVYQRDIRDLDGFFNTQTLYR